MSNNPSSNVKLLPRLIAAFKMKPSDTAIIEADLLERMKQSWRTAISEQARMHGCNVPANDPRLSDLVEVKRLAHIDAVSITQTWNTDVERELTRLFNARPRGNRFYYLEGMETWSANRDISKSPLIGLMTEKNLRAYAKDRFWQENDLTGGLYFYGLPLRVVSEACQFRRAAGVYDYAFVKANETPAHVGCEHEHELLAKPRLDCATIWVG